MRNEKPPSRQLQTRINLNYIPLSRLSMDIKVMPKSNKRHKFVLYITDEVTYYLITTPLYQAKSKEVREVLIENIITKYCIPDCIIMDQDSTFMSSLMNYVFTKFNIKIKMVPPYNHESLKAEHRIKSLSTILSKYLTSLGQMWPKYLSLSMFPYVTGTEKGLGKETTRFRLSIIFGFLAWTPADVQTNHGSSTAHVQ